MSLFLNGRTYSCLVCPKSSPSCSEQQHPLQRLLSYEELISKYARKVNSDQYDAIGIYTCPYCALDRLTVDTLYAHSRDTHPPAVSNGALPLPAVHCPVCVCFRLENSPAFIQPHSGGLSEHMLNRHCFATTHQYRDELKLRSEFCCEDEFELIRFTATFLPPAIITSEVLSGYPDGKQDGLQSHDPKQMQPVCPICLEQIDPTACKNLQLCVHQFHPLCIDRWLEEKKCCPVCRCECT
uniref:RING-type domain-containing protein n=1 Tax=Anopheles culicifacies TaxID=139723 RepID=A0A182LZA8_9DIPT